MIFSILNPFLGRTLLRTRALQFTRTASPVLLTRSFLTSPVPAKETVAKKPRAKPGKTKSKAKPKPNAKVSKPKPKPVFKRDLKAVKGPLTSWMDFVLQYTAKNKTPGDTMARYVKEASVKWRAMSLEEKSKYGPSPEEKAKTLEARKEYRRTIEYKRAARKFKVKRVPTNPMNPYARFVKEYYDRESALTFTEQGIALAAKWKALSDSEKESWKHKAKEEFELKKNEATA